MTDLRIELTVGRGGYAVEMVRDIAGRGYDEMGRVSLIADEVAEIVVVIDRARLRAEAEKLPALIAQKERELDELRARAKELTPLGRVRP